MNSYTPERVMNGSWGELWIDSDYMAETTALEAKVTLTTTDVPMCRTLYKGYKVTGIECKGMVKINHASSYFLNKMSDMIKHGKTPRATIISKVDDPDAFGAERIKLNDCVFTEITLANWEAGKLMEDSVPFSFTDWEVLESVE